MGFSKIDSSSNFDTSKDSRIFDVSFNDSINNVFLFSVVVAVYNTADYLDEAINSVINQTIGFEKNIQLILVNDGSTDGSALICKKYFDAYPNNIVFINKLNEGVSKARNAGVQYATGKYINFMDSDDKFDKNAFYKVNSFLKNNDALVDVVTCRTELFGDKVGDTWYNEKFKKGTRIINLWKDPQIYLNSTNNSFFHRRVINQLHFDEAISIAEDFKVVNTVLMNKWTLGVVCDAVYYYRIRSNSLVSSGKHVPQYYMAYLEHVVEWFIDMCKKRCGFIPKYLQYSLLRELYNRFNNNIEIADVLSNDEQEAYLKRLKRAVCEIDDDVILHNSFLNKDYYVYFLSIKHGEPELEYNKKDNAIDFKWGNIIVKKAPYFCLNNISIEKDMLRIEGYCVVNNVGPAPISLYVQYGDDYIEIPALKNTTKDHMGCGHEVVFYRRYFDVELPLREANLKINFSYYGKILPFCCSSVGKWCPIGNGAFIHKNGYAVYFSNNQIEIKKATKRDVKRFESEYRKTIKKDDSKMAKQSLCVRKIWHFVKHFFKKQIWIISDRHHMGGDNGQALYEYVSNNKRNIRAFFAVDGDTKTYQDAKKVGRVLRLDSRKYKFYFLMADAIVSSHFDTTELFAVNYKYIRDIIAEKKFVFLQHGITKDDISNYYSREKQRLDMFVTATKPEYNSVVNNGNYFLGKSRTQLLGFPRYDKLKNEQQRIIVVAPTWRNNCVTFRGNGVAPIVDDGFLSSYYYSFYHGLMSDERLLKGIKEYGYQLVYFPHYNFVPTNKFFYDIDGLKILDDESRDYSDAFSSAALWVTDYSSTAFDFAYLGKPVIYCQGDSETFFASHTYHKGYYDVERDGFGTVVYDIDSAVEKILYYLQTGCRMEDVYKERVKHTFAYLDKNNSERVSNAIERLVKNGKN